MSFIMLMEMLMAGLDTPRGHHHAHEYELGDVSDNSSSGSHIRIRTPQPPSVEPHP